MVSLSKFTEIALALPNASEHPHFENTSYKAKNKIFATLNPIEIRACLKFTTEQQAHYCAIDENLIFPVPNKWGTHGWTFVNLKLINTALLQEVLDLAYSNVVKPKKAK
jgi:hypothetical protein